MVNNITDEIGIRRLTSIIKRIEESDWDNITKVLAIGAVVDSVFEIAHPKSGSRSALRNALRHLKTDLLDPITRQNVR